MRPTPHKADLCVLTSVCDLLLHNSALTVLVCCCGFQNVKRDPAYEAAAQSWIEELTEESFPEGLLNLYTWR